MTDDAESVAREGAALRMTRALPRDDVDEPRRTEAPFDRLLPKLEADPAGRRWMPAARS